QLDIRGFRELAALVDERDLQLPPRRLGAQRERALAVREPYVAPGGHRQEGEAERLSHPGQRILDARALSVLAIFALLDQAGLDQAVETMAQHAARNVEIGLKIIEAAHAVERRAQDQQGPAVADQVEAAREVAVLRRDGRAANER